LGLTICKRFCEMLGGRIEAESTVGEGSTFSVYLPEEARGAGLGEESSAMMSSPLDEELEGTLHEESEGPSVLVIDDDPDVHELMRRFLAPRGFRIHSALEGREGIERARELMPDVITLDVMMPDRDGWSVLSTLKADDELESIPVVMVTMIDDKSIGYALGAAEYLVKPIEQERLVRVLSRFKKTGEARALIVEDEANIRELMARHLKKVGWTVETAANGKEALDILDETVPEVVILDLMMPQMDGFEVADVMRQEPRWKDIPIVVVTAMELDAAEQARLEESVERILSKQSGSIDEVLTEVLEVTGVQVAQPEELSPTGQPAALSGED
ncbi:MAG: response regulator, partial [Persicimonas sp.]